MRMKLLKKQVKKKQAKSGCEQKWYCKSGYFKLVIFYGQTIGVGIKYADA